MPKFGVLLKLAGVVISFITQVDAKYAAFQSRYFDSLMTERFDEEITATAVSCAIKCSRITYCSGFNFDQQTSVCRLYKHTNQSLTEENINFYLLIEKGCGIQHRTPFAVTSVSKHNYEIGTEVNYTCVAGTYLVGSHESKCLPSRDWDNLFINCSIAKTCHQAHQLGLDVIPTVTVKPSEDEEAITVNCEISGSDVYTVAEHDLSPRTYLSGYERKQGFRLEWNYSLPIPLLGSIADASAECEQYIEMECDNSVFHYQGIVTRNGSIATYYAGGVKGQFNCACNINDTCLEGYKCNCDINNLLTSDSGYNKYKEDLPITAFLVGDTGRSEEYFYLTIGSMRCKG